MVTTTGQRWECQGNCAPGCTVYLATTVREGSRTLTTRFFLPSSLIFTLSLTSSVNTARAVRNSVAMGGGGVCAADGITFRTRTTPASSAAPTSAPAFLVFTLPPSLGSGRLNRPCTCTHLRGLVPYSHLWSTERPERSTEACDGACDGKRRQTCGGAEDPPARLAARRARRAVGGPSAGEQGVGPPRLSHPGPRPPLAGAAGSSPLP